MKISTFALITGFSLLASGFTLAEEILPATAEPLAAETVQVPVEAAPENVKTLVPANLMPIGEFTSHYKQKSTVISSANDSSINMTYFWFEPQPAPVEGKTYPLVLVLHGTKGYAEPAYHLIKESVRTPYPAYILVPALPAGQRWADPGKIKPVHSLPDAITLLKKVMTENPIDPARVYVMGCGTGGTGTYGAAQLYSDIFAAAVPIAATWNPKETENMKNVAIAAFHGANDELVKHYNSSDTVTMAQSHGGTAFFTLFDGMKHDCNAPSLYTSTLWQWLFSQKKTIPDPTP